QGRGAASCVARTQARPAGARLLRRASLDGPVGGFRDGAELTEAQRDRAVKCATSERMLAEDELMFNGSVGIVGGASSSPILMKNESAIRVMAVVNNRLHICSPRHRCVRAAIRRASDRSAAAKFHSVDGRELVVPQRPVTCTAAQLAESD